MMRRSPIACVLVALLAVPLAGDETETKTVKLEKGSPAPVFELRDDSGKLWKSGDHVGKKTLVVFFYPAALTGG